MVDFLDRDLISMWRHKMVKGKYVCPFGCQGEPTAQGNQVTVRGENATRNEEEGGKKHAGIAIFIGLFVSHGEDRGYTRSSKGVKVDEIGNGVFLWTDGTK